MYTLCPCIKLCIAKREKSEIGATTIQIMKAYKFEKLIVSSLELFPHFNFQKIIVSAETIRGNTVFSL